jgi:phage pi2 protein 07
MDDEEYAKLILRYTIRDEFTERLRETCNMRLRICRGGSRDLYRMIVKSPSMRKEMNLENLQIVSGLGHTFIRYKDDKYNRFIYIDPTIAQFDREFEGIFVGDEQDLRDIAARQSEMKGYKLDLRDYLGPPLQIETKMMAGLAGGRRVRRSRRGRSTRRRRA